MQFQFWSNPGLKVGWYATATLP